MGQVKRVYTCLTISDDDHFLWCGTQTGDVVEVNARNGRFVRTSRQRFERGVISIAHQAEMNVLLVGCGSGKIATLNGDSLRKTHETNLLGVVTSITLDSRRGNTHAFLGTSQSNIYYISLSDLLAELRTTCHYSKINDICFPENCSDLFVTCSQNDIRVWNANERQELLRIQVPNLECHCICVSSDGRSIVSGWSDGKIRAFFPESGRLKYVITDAHRDGVTALAMTGDCSRIVSGGMDGQVRIWSVHEGHQDMEASMKEHRGPVNSIRITRDDSECVSASSDGSCIIWDLNRSARKNCLFASTMFRAALYHPDESQILTCGSDRKITYWDPYDANAIRILDGSDAEIYALDIDPDGVMFVSGGEDRVVQVLYLKKKN